MARTTKPAAPHSNALVSWDERLAADAAVAAGMEANAGGGNFFSLRGGILAFNDTPMPNNQMAVIIADSILENIFYEGSYDSDNPSPPTCFAFGRDEATIKPHATVFEKGQEQNDQCRGCPMNEWGTADKGRGKACRNTRRLALIPAGDLNAEGKFSMTDDVNHYETIAAAMMKLPVTSVKAYATYVKQVAGVHGRPPFGIFTKIKLVPDQATQFKVVFEFLGKVPDKFMEAVMVRNTEAKATIETPYNLEAMDAPPKKAPAKAKRPPVKKKY